jgi:hypothetical protein
MYIYIYIQYTYIYPCKYNCNVHIYIHIYYKCGQIITTSLRPRWNDGLTVGGIIAKKQVFFQVNDILTFTNYFQYTTIESGNFTREQSD